MTIEAAKRRVVITGLGAVTPLGSNLPDTWNGLIEGVSVAAPISRFDASRFPCQIAYEVRNFDLNHEVLQRGDEMFLNTAAGFAINAAAEAIANAGFQQGALDPWRTAVCVGTGLPSPDADWYDGVYRAQNFSDPSLLRHVRFLPDQVGSVLARMLKAKGGMTTVHTACASSGQALGEAYEMIAYGDVDVVLTGGADSMINPFSLAGFSLLGAVSKRNEDPRTASRPFDAGRDGFVFGEGAGMLIFEAYDHAVARGAAIFGEVKGYGVTESAYRITDLHPEGTGPIEAMTMALADAGLPPEAIGYINAHGTSTQLNDRIEALAIGKVFGRTNAPFVSSTKSLTGHTIAAAGALEFAICVKALEYQVLPPSVHIFAADADCPITLTPPVPVRMDLQYALSNSVGFGGSNTALIAGRVQR